MRRSPGFTAVAVVSLAIGIGANTTMFGTVDRLLVRAPTHVRDADRIHRVYFATPSTDGRAEPRARQGYRTYAALRDHVPQFEAVAGVSARSVSSGRGTGARPMEAVIASPSFFPMLGVSPALGRFFTVDEETAEAEAVAVISYGTWQGTYAGDSAVLGRVIDVSGVPHTIVGVAPNGFTGIDPNRVDLWLPLGAATRLISPRALDPASSGYWMDIIVKRRVSAPAASAAAQATQAYHDAWRDERRFEETYGKSRAVLGPIIAARGPAAGADAKVAMWVAIVSIIVLLIACANVANLLLLRGLTRSRDVALRLSLGASRWRIARQWLVEGALLAGAGAVFALILASWSASAMQAFLLPRDIDAPVIDARLLGFTAIVALGTALIATAAPSIIVARRRDLSTLLGTGRVLSATSRLVVQRTLIGVQVALATMLLIGAGLFVTSLRNVRAIDLGVDVDRILYAKLDVRARTKGPASSAAGAVARAEGNATYMVLLERVRRVPGVVSATVTAGEPLTSGWGITVLRRGAPPLREGTPVPFGRAVGPDYFETMGTSLRQGRLFTDADHRPGARVAIIDEATARDFWPNESPLDPCVYLGDSDCTRVVGVVENTVLWQVTGDRGRVVYVPIGAWGDQEISAMEIRTAGDPSAMIGAVRQAIVSGSPDLPWVDIRPVSEIVAPQLRSWRLGASMFTAFGILALGLAAVGLYGLLSYVVARRSHEIGVRKALGASDGGVVSLVLRSGMGMTAVGLAAGLAVALGASRFVADQLYGVSPRNPVVIALGLGALLVVAFLACIVPARRAARVDPMVTLRSY